MYLPMHGDMMVPVQASPESNTAHIASLLYTEHVLAFEWVALILLVAMVAAIALTFKGRLSGTKAQSARAQMAVRPEKRMRLVEGK